MLSRLANRLRSRVRPRGRAACVDLAMSFQGQITRGEVGALVDLARRVEPGAVIVEIGSYRGRSTIALACGSLLGSQNRVYAVDPHDPYVGALGGVFGPQDQAALYRNLTTAGVGHLASVVSLSSVAAGSGWSRQNIGLLWIDGDHHYSGVRLDFDTWYPWVTPPGVIAFHDCNVEDIRRLIGEEQRQGTIQPFGECETIQWFRKG